MNVYVMVDIEGISGVYCPEQVKPSGWRYNEGRRYMTDEVNVCVRALKEAGAGKVYVRDAHGGSETLIWDELTDEADGYICGRLENERYPFLTECGGLILLGYHAMAGTSGGTLEHTMSSASVQRYRVNGREIGEIALDAAIAGERGVPVLLVTGDDKACDEAASFLPEAKTCRVKTGLSPSGAMLLPRDTAHRRLAEAVKAAVAGPVPPVFTFPGPVRLEIELTERSPLPTTVGRPYMSRVDGRTYAVSAPTLEEAFFLAL